MTIFRITITSLLSAFVVSCGSPSEPLSGQYVGYVEAIPLFVSATQTGRIEQVLVQEGDEVSQGQKVAVLEHGSQQIAVQQAQAQLELARQELKNLQQGSRSEEVRVVQLQLQEQIALRLAAEHELQRQTQMMAEQSTSQSNFDQAKASYEALDARVEQLEQQLQVLKLPARDHIVLAAQQNVEAAQQNLNQQNWQLQQRTLLAPANGTVEEVFYRVGEILNPGIPILSVHQADSMKVRFYVVQNKLSSLKLGQSLSFSDDDGNQAQAVIQFIAQQPEFAPPVLYGQAVRDSLVFMVEAKIVSGQFRPGQPVDILL